MMKKLLLAIVLVSVCLGVRAGESELRMAWWGGGERHEATLAALQTYEKENPGVTVKAEYMGWDGYLERLTTQIGGNSEADIMQMDWAWLALFSKNGDGFYDLNQAKDVINLAAYDQKWLDTCTVKGKLNALPVSFTTRFFIWNTTTFEKAGVPVPKTWDDLYAAGRAFKEKLGDEYYPMDVDHGSIPHIIASYIYQKTGNMIISPTEAAIGLSHEEMVEMVAFYKRLLDNHVMPSLSVRANISGTTRTQTHEMPDFIEGRWAGGWYWDSNIHLFLSTPRKEYSFQLGEFLVGDNDKTSGRIGRPAQIFAVSKNSKNPKVAAALASWLLTTPEAAKILRTTRGALISNPSFAALKEANLIPAMNLEAMAQLENQQVSNPSPYFEDPRVLKLLEEVCENVSFGKMNPEEAATEIERELNRILRRLSR